MLAKTHTLYHAMPTVKVWPRPMNHLLPPRRYMTISERRHRYLHQQYAGESCTILSCGPSLAEVWSDDLAAYLREHLTISIKQAHDLAPEMSDFHLYNEVRMQDYTYPSSTFRMSVSRFQPTYPGHIFYPIADYSYANALFVTNNYEAWDLHHQGILRPWGIGIMFELGLHLPIYLGCRRVVIIGFDMNPTGKYHFYDDDERQNSDFYRVDKEEFDYASQSIPHYLAWAASQGVEVRLYSPLSALPFEQVTSFEAMYDFLEGKS